MAYGERYIAFPTVYTDLIAPVQAALVDCGWTQVGATNIYKSATPNELGFHAYVRVFDDGATIAVEAGCRLNDAETDFYDSIIYSSAFLPHQGWFIYVYPWWFMCYGADIGNSNYRTHFIGGGLFKAPPGSRLSFNPYFIRSTGPTSVDEVNYSDSRGQMTGNYIKRLNNDNVQGGHSSILGARYVSAWRQMDRVSFGLHGGMISPAFVVTPSSINSIWGTFYNTKIFSTFYVSNTTVDNMSQSGQSMLINGVRYITLPRYALMTGYCEAPVFQAPGTFV